MSKIEYVKRTAAFTADNSCRYMLFRQWDEKRPALMVIGLNPSRADHTTDDPTIRRTVQIANANGYGALVMVNLYPYITPHPEKLQHPGPRESLHNHRTIEQYASLCADVAFAWGNFKQATDLGKYWTDKIPGALVFGQNKNGSPKHPLYLPATTRLRKLKNEEDSWIHTPTPKRSDSIVKGRTPPPPLPATENAML